MTAREVHYATSPVIPVAQHLKCKPLTCLIWLRAHSAGRQHRQLVKSGNDDLRQDAVMQQFFGLINALLAANPAAAKRRLSMTTYKARPSLL